MSKEYNEWYWKLYRWFKWEAKHLHRDIAQGFKNLWKWFPIVWKDRDFDDHFIFEVLKFKIKNTTDYFEIKQRFVGWEDEVRYMRICEKLIERIQSDYYQSEYFDYCSFNVEWLPIEGNDDFVELKRKETKNEVAKYITKYPNTHRLVMNNPLYKGFKEEYGIALAIGIERHLKARKLLFKILERKIESWWD